MVQPTPADRDSELEQLDLLGRVSRGDAEALRRIYDSHAPHAFALALRVLRARGEAEEVVQETFLEVWRRAREYDPRRGAPSAWISTICRTRAIDRLRARASQERTEGALQFESPVAPSPGDLAEMQQARMWVRAALADLPVEQRRVLELSYFEGLSQSEVAERTGDPLGTVKTRVRLGMEKLSAALAELWGSGKTS